MLNKLLIMIAGLSRKPDGAESNRGRTVES